MITDSRFWSEVRSTERSNLIFKTALVSLQHSIFLSATISHLSDHDRKKKKTIINNSLCTLYPDHRSCTCIDRSSVLANRESCQCSFTPNHREILQSYVAEYGSNSQLTVPYKLGYKCVQSKVLTSTIRVLQRLMMFSKDLGNIKYKVPLFSVSRYFSCLIDEKTKELWTFGRNSEILLPKSLHIKQCAATNHGIVLLLDNGVLCGSHGVIEYIESSKNRNLTTPFPTEYRTTKISSGKVHDVLNEESQTNTEQSGESSCKSSKFLGPSLFPIAKNVSVVFTSDNHLSFLTNSLDLCIFDNAVPNSLMPQRAINYAALSNQNIFMIDNMGKLYHTNTVPAFTKPPPRQSAKPASSVSENEVFFHLTTPRSFTLLDDKIFTRVACGEGFNLFIDQFGSLVVNYVRGGWKPRSSDGAKNIASSFQCPIDYYPNLKHHFFTQVAAGSRHGLALTINGAVYVTGNNSKGQLGLPSRMRYVASFSLLCLPSSCLGIAAGAYSSLFYCLCGIYACGENNNNHLGTDLWNSCIFTPTRICSSVVSLKMLTMNFKANSSTILEDAATEIPFKHHHGKANNLSKIPPPKDKIITTRCLSC